MWSLNTLSKDRPSSADWWFGSDTAMGAMPVIAVKPDGQFGGALVGCVVGCGVGPLAQAGLNEALGLSVGLGRVGFGPQVLDFEPAQGRGVAAGSEARAIVGHDALDLHAEASKEAQGVEQETQTGASLLVRQDFRIGKPGVVVDRQMHIFPADPSGLALAGALAGDAVADAIELAELFDVDVDDLAGSCALVAADRLGRFESGKPIEAQPLQDAADRGGRNPDFRGDLLAGMALPAQSLDPFACGRRRLAWR